MMAGSGSEVPSSEAMADQGILGNDSFVFTLKNQAGKTSVKGLYSISVRSALQANPFTSMFTVEDKCSLVTVCPFIHDNNVGHDAA